MTEKQYKELLAEAQRIDAEFEKKYSSRMLIPKKLNERRVERLCKLEKEITELKRDLRENGIAISNNRYLESDGYSL
jgi:hypothetical protein